MNKVDYFADTNVGRVRTNNEDTFIARPIWDDQHYLFVVIDGMGGYEGGEVAADIVRNSINKYLDDFSNGKPLDLLKQAVLEANNEIIRYKEASPMYKSMGCVASAALYESEKSVLNVVHVGDTRLYLFADGQLQKLTHDHTLVGYQEEQGELTEEEAMNHPQRSVIERYMGETTHMLGDKNFLDAGIFPINESSQIVLCSDGLYDMITSREITEILQEEMSVEQKNKALIDLANEKGGRDNVTVIVVDINVDDAKINQNTVGTQDSRNSSEDTSAGSATTKRLLFSKTTLATAVIALVIGGFSGYYISNSKTIRVQKALEETISLKDSVERENASLLKKNGDLEEKIQRYRDVLSTDNP